jgi:hypothetical protein
MPISTPAPRIALRKGKKSRPRLVAIISGTQWDTALKTLTLGCSLALLQDIPLEQSLLPQESISKTTICQFVGIASRIKEMGNQSAAIAISR